MKEMFKPEEQYQEELLELYQQIVELEKMEVQRQRSGLTLAELEKKCHELFDEIDQGITIIQDQKIKYANPRAAEILGYSPEEIANTLWAHFVDPDQLPKLVEIYKKRIAGEEVQPVYETTLRHKDGQKIDISIKAAFIIFEGRPADFAIVNEISPAEDQNRDT